MGGNVTETNIALSQAIAKCDEIKARLEALREMSEPKPVLRLEPNTRPGTYRELHSADDLADAAPGTVIIGPNYRYLRTCDPANPWTSRIGCWMSNAALWGILIGTVNSGTTVKYLAAD